MARTVKRRTLRSWSRKSTAISVLLSETLHVALGQRQVIELDCTGVHCLQFSFIDCISSWTWDRSSLS
jgi:hypothetical protein